MLLSAATRAFSQLFAPELRGVFWKALGLTIVLLIALVTLIQTIGNSFIDLDSAWLGTAIAFLTGFGLLIGAGFLLAPVMSVFAGLFLDEVAEAIEKRDYSQDRPGVPMEFGKSIRLSIRFLLLVVGVNILALFLLLIPGINIAVFFIANGYLLGREYFQFVAMRFYDVRDAQAMRSQYSGTVMLAGLLIAFVLSIPIINLLTPLFATAFMVHVFKELEHKSR